MSLFGTYWDDAWHTDRGRDSFFAAPHLALYAGVFVALVGVSLAGDETATWWARGLGFAALTMASVNIFGGFLVTQRMLAMYRKKDK